MRLAREPPSLLCVPAGHTASPRVNEPFCSLGYCWFKNKAGKQCFGWEGGYAKETCLKEQALIAFALILRSPEEEMRRRLGEQT